MIPPNRLEITPRVTAIRIGSEFAVRFPFDHDAKRVARHGPGAHWDPGMKSWLMKGYDIDRVMGVMEEIHSCLVAAGKDRTEDRAPTARVDWSLVPSALLPHDSPDLERGGVLYVGHGHIVIEEIGDPFTCEGSEPGARQGISGTEVCRAWHRPAFDREVREHYERQADNAGPEV